jgi:hypothetical protein
LPSIDLARLRQQGLELAGLLGDPDAFRVFLHSLLERHSHRLLRRGRSMARRSALPAWDVPGLLIREVEAALLPAAEANPDAALRAAVAIWPAGKLEERQLAAYLAGLSRNPGEIRSLLIQWLMETEDPAVLQDLARRTCPPLRRSNGLLFRSDVRGWIADPHPPRRRFGWMALRQWTEEKTSESLFAAFELLPAVFSESDPEAMQLAVDLLALLAEYSPRETQAWLSDLTSKSRQQGRRFLRSALARLPEETAARLRGLLREDEP